MKKLLLTLSIFLSTAVAYSQVIFAGVEPAAIQGAYDMTWGDPGGGWGGPDLE
jgi:hypothetical protein